MLPEHILSSTPVVGSYFEPDSKQAGMLFDFEMGGIAIQDPSQGLLYQLWVCWYTRNGEIRVRPASGSGTGTLIAVEPGVRRLSFSFDRNMQPAVAWELTDRVKFRWFDSTVPGFTISEYVGGRTPRVYHDDKRAISTATSDVLLAYLKDDQLIAREQRDRYLVEYVLRAGLPDTLRLNRVGMTTQNRIQFELR